MAARAEIDGDAQHWLDQLTLVDGDADMARRCTNAFLDVIYRLYNSAWPEAKADKAAFFERMQGRDRTLILDTLAMLVRGGGVHNLTADTSVVHGPLYVSGKLFLGPYTFPGPQFHFPPLDPTMGLDDPRMAARREAYARLIEDTPVLPTLYGALESVRAVIRDAEAEPT